VNQPTLVYHADWSSHAANRWCAMATLGADGLYTASEPIKVGELESLLSDLRHKAGECGTVFAGFDFPIGVPAHFAKRAQISKFRDFLLQLGKDKWTDFYSVCDTPEEVSVHRPFYPMSSRKGSLRQHLFDAHNAKKIADLLRSCECGGGGQRQASSLFWTLGANAVGKAAIAGWRDVLAPAVESNSIRLWPFDGKLESLFQPGRTVIAETYPAECYTWFSGDPLLSKTNMESRENFGSRLLSWADANGVVFEPRLRTAIEAGFPEGEDDAFDAVVGLFGMLQICLGPRTSGEPDDETIREIEGWILGRQSQPVAEVSKHYSANTDPELTDWLRWASESGEVPYFVKTLAEAALIADLPHYALLRPVLLELKREMPRTSRIE
jgi:hypothetical protein